MFSIKSKNLFNYFLRFYSKPTFKLISIDKTRTVIFYTQKSNRYVLSRHVEEFFTDESLSIKHFNSNDASQIGYLYGIWLQSSK